MEQPQGDSEADVLQRLEGFFDGGQADQPEQEAAVEAQPQEVADDEQPQDAAEETPAEDDPGLVEIEAEDGQTYKVPAALKDGYLRQADYTRKTQDAKDLAKNAAFTLQEKAWSSQFEEWTKPERTELSDLKLEIKQYKKSLTQIDDMNLAWRTQQHVAQLEDKAKELEGTLSTKKQQFDSQLGQARSEAARHAADFISRNVKGWAPNNELDREVGGFAHALGIPPELMTEMTVRFPGFGVMAAKAALYEKLQSSTPKAVQKAQKAPPVVKPGAVTSTNSAAAQRARDIQGRFQKSGGLDDFARLLLAKGMVK